MMEEPSELTEGTLLELRRIVEDYPYFQVARMLYLKNLAVLNDMSFTSELERMAIFLPDRKKLFQLIEGDKYGLNSRVEHEPDMRKEDTFSLIDAFLSNRNEEPEPKKEAPFLFQPSVSSDYMFWSLSKEEEENPEAKPPPFEFWINTIKINSIEAIRIKIEINTYILVLFFSVNNQLFQKSDLVCKVNIFFWIFQA